LFKTPPNLKINSSLKGVAQLFAEGVFNGAIYTQVLSLGLNTSHDRVTSPSKSENPPIRYI
jgi:hypothetical protein